jgi:hypothetical protein
VIQAEGGLAADPTFRFGVTLGEPEQLRGQPIVIALRQLISQTGDLLWPGFHDAAVAAEGAGAAGAGAVAAQYLR